MIIAEGSRLWKLEDRCFRDCAIEKITLPGTLTSMSFDAFRGCDSLRTVYVEDGCGINVRAYPLRNVSVLPAKETMIGNKMLWDPRGLKSVCLVEGLEKLGSYWFCRSQIESISIPVSVREIGVETFCGCERLRDVLIDARILNWRG